MGWSEYRAKAKKAPKGPTRRQAPYNVAMALEESGWLSLRVNLANARPGKPGRSAMVAHTFGTVKVPGAPGVVVQLTVWRKP